MKTCLITIGTGAGIAVQDRGGAAHLIIIDNTTILLDCGEGAAGWLKSLDQLKNIEYVFLSHLHADHVSGLFMLLQNMLLDGRKRPLTIYMPEKGIETFRSMQDTVYLTGDITAGQMFDIAYKPLYPEIIIQTNTYIIQSWISDHFLADIDRGIETTRFAFGFTIDVGERRLVYTADVATVDCFLNQLKPKTTLLCEAMHIDWQEIIELSYMYQLKQVIFVHPDPVRVDQLNVLCSKYENVILAEDGMEIKW